MIPFYEPIKNTFITGMTRLMEMRPSSESGMPLPKSGIFSFWPDLFRSFAHIVYAAKKSVARWAGKLVVWMIPVLIMQAEHAEALMPTVTSDKSTSFETSSFGTPGVESPAFETPASAAAISGTSTLQPSPFEGNIVLSRYTVSTDGTKDLASRTSMTVHPGYMLLQQAEGGAVDLFGDIRAEGVLVRQQREQFVFFTTDKKAVYLNKQELQQMITMLEAMQGGNSSLPSQPPEVTLEQTDERKTIRGYPARKWLVKAEDSLAEWHIWVTGELFIPWGMLAESWLIRQTFFSGLPAKEWVENNRLPIRAELWNAGILAEVVAFEEIAEQSIPVSEFQIPDDYEQINFQQLLFNRMRNR